MGDESQGIPTEQGDHGSDFDPTHRARGPDKKDDVNDEPSAGHRVRTGNGKCILGRLVSGGIAIHCW